jgi:hypothetical protein
MRGDSSSSEASEDDSSEEEERLNKIIKDFRMSNLSQEDSIKSKTIIRGDSAEFIDKNLMLDERYKE